MNSASNLEKLLSFINFPVNFYKFDMTKEKLLELCAWIEGRSAQLSRRHKFKPRLSRSI